MQVAGRGRVLKTKFFVWIYKSECGLRHQRGLVETREDKLELARIIIDVADCEDTRRIGREFFGIDGDQVLMEVEAEICDRPELHRETVERQQRIARHDEIALFLAFHSDARELAAIYVQAREIRNHEIHFIFTDQRAHLVHRIRRRAEIIAPMQKRHRFCNRLQVDRPVERGISAAGDDEILAFELIHFLDGIEDRGAFMGLKPVDGRLLRHEGPAARRDDDHGGDQYRAVIRQEFPASVILLFEAFSHLGKMEGRLERRDLFQKPLGQVMAADDGPGRNIVNRFFRVKFGALPARTVKNIDQMAFNIQKAEFKDGKQANRACPYDNRICFMNLRHVLLLKGSKRIGNIHVWGYNLGMSDKRLISLWLFICCGMVMAMVVIGAITRLTESGLSITEWNVVMGALPPLNEAAWLAEFDKYKASPEFELKHYWMTVEDFKGIFFWEWFHRLWGRLIGLVFALPLIVFWVRKKIPSSVKPHLVGLLFLGAAQGYMGWYMVQSGLVDRPSVSHYRLAAHLSLALIVYSYMLWLGLKLWRNDMPAANTQTLPAPCRLHGLATLACVATTIVWGAFVAGLDAGMIYNTFPLMGNGLVPPEMWSRAPAWINLFENHASVQFAHRVLGILTGLVVASYAVRGWLASKQPVFVYVGLWVLVQIGLGISTLVSQVWIPVAVFHQLGAVILLSLVIAAFQTRSNSR